MVLLTASTISAAISGIVICLFTFLLFLSGYVLQQQTVKSLQEALAAPIEVRVRVQPTLPPQFRKQTEDELQTENSENDTISADSEPLNTVKNTIQVVLGDQTVVENAQTESDSQELWHAHVEDSPSQLPSNDLQLPDQPATWLSETFDGRFAYVLALSKPADLCSAILFTKWYRQFSQIPQNQVNLIFLYPDEWEKSSGALYADALRLLLQSEHKHSVLLHPVQMSQRWTGIDVESQLLSELARNPWPYDRVIYLRTPGMLLDTTRLDQTLVSTYTEPAQLKTFWTKLRPPVRRGGAATLHPDVLLYAQGGGLMTPTGTMQRTLTAKAQTNPGSDHHDEVKDEFLAKEAAYILFDAEELEHREKEKIFHSGIFERFERERELVCEGTSLLV